MLEVRYGLERERIAKLKDHYDADTEHPVFGEGNSDSPVIMFIGEAPGREEAASGRPFVGKAGKQLDEMLALAGIDRREVFVTNAVKYRPTNTKEKSVSNRTPKPQEVREGLGLLSEEIACVRPKVIATLGNTPLSAVSQLNQGNSAPLTVGQAHGQPTVMLIGGERIRLFPLYHPAAAIYNRELKPVLEQDLINLGFYCKSLEE